jgi:hypothetical protein
MKLIGAVVTVNVAMVAPLVITTLNGTFATPTAILLLKLTTRPLSGAGAVSVIVPVTGEPLFTVPGLSFSDDTNGSGGTSVSVAFCEPPPRVAVTVTFVTEATADV